MFDWGSWRTEPVLIAVLGIAGWAYALACGPGRPRLAPGAPWPRREAKSFYAGIAVLYLAWSSPLDLAARLYLCSAHAVQDVAVLFPAAILILRGLPFWLADAVLRRVRGVARLLLHPVLCAAGFVLVVSAGYLPVLLEPALRSDLDHALRALAYLAAALVFWWPLLSPSRLIPPLGYGARLLYLLAVEVAMTGVFTYLLMAEHGIYPTYGHAPRLSESLTPYEDQVLAGVILSVVSSLFFVGALGLTFRKWAREEDGGRTPFLN